MMASISSKYYQFILAQGVCSSLGASALFYPAVNSVATWFSKRRALALGVVASGSSLGGVIFPIMVEWLVPQVGFGWAMRICAFFGTCLVHHCKSHGKVEDPAAPETFPLQGLDQSI
jgi:MFS family permease